jgi:hypothetical protein
MNFMSLLHRFVEFASSLKFIIMALFMESSSQRRNDATTQRRNDATTQLMTESHEVHRLLFVHELASSFR